MLNFAGSQYYDIPRTVLFWIGLWPGDNTKVGKARRMLSCTILVAGLASLPLLVVISQGSFKWTLNLLPCVFLSLMFAIKYSTFYVSAPRIITILNHIKEDWAMIKYERELRILEEYTVFGRFLAKLATVLFFQPLIGFLLCSLMPCFLALENPSDTARRYKMPFIGLWFEEKYYYIIVICWSTQALFGVFTLLATESSMLLFTQHTCGILGVACYRMRHALDEESESVPYFKHNHLVCDRLISAIIMYQRAIKLADLLTLAFASSYIMLLSIGVVSLSVNLFRLSREFMRHDGWDELITCILLIVCHLGYMFLANCIAQQVSNQSRNMFMETYDTTWYRASLPAAKLLLMILQGTVKGYTFSVRGIFAGSLEGFSKLLSISLSYFTFMYNTQ